jgi:hypothetical protein
MRLSHWLRSARSRLVPSGTKRDSGQLARRARPGRLNVECLEDRTVPSTFSVSNLADSGDGSLRAAIAAANANPGDDDINFAPGLRGTVVLASGELNILDDVRIDGPGAARLAVSGNDASRVFKIESGADVSIDGLTVTHGRALLRGGGIWNLGSLTLSDAVVSNNVVFGVPGSTQAEDPQGGGLLNNGTVNVSRTVFSGNRSVGGDGVVGLPGSTALGGGMMSVGSPAAPASATVTYCSFLDNEAVGGAIGAGPFSRAGLGGAIMNSTGSTTVSHSYFSGNRAVGGAGGGFVGGAGAGGAIANIALVANSTISVRHSTLVNNQALGGAGVPGKSAQVGRGGAIANFVAPVAALPVTVAATATVSNSLILGNLARGGSGDTGANGHGGGITNENGGILTVANSLIALNRAIGGEGLAGNGGNGLGGGIFNGPPNPFGTPNLTLNRDLVLFNQAEGGASTGGTAGQGIGGGVYVGPGSAASANLTAIRANDASTSDDDVFGILV